MSNRQALIDALQASDAPLPLSTFGTQVRKAGIKIKNDALREALGELAREGIAFQHPVGRQSRNPSPRFWHRSASDYVRQTLTQALARQEQWTLGQLRKLVQKPYHDILDEQIGALLERDALYEAPRSGKTRRFQTEPPRPTQSLTATQRKSLQTILNRVNAVRRSPLQLDALLALLDGEPASAARSGPAPRSPELSESLLLRLYGEDLQRRGGLRSMPIPWTWERYAQLSEAQGGTPDLARFHSLLKTLHSQGRIALAVHDVPASIPAAERRVLPERGDGWPLYYWTPVDVPR